MKVDLYFDPHAGLAGAKSSAERAARLGYDGFFTAETSHEPFFPLVLASQAAPELTLGTAIALAFPRSPMTIAQVAWDLAAVSEGKLILGLGTQVKAHIVRRFSGEWFSPGPRMRDYIAALRAIWNTFQTGAPLKYEGEFYKFSLMTPFFNPGPIDHPEIPVAIAGVGLYMARLAGEVCQGFHVHPFHTVKYLDEVVLPRMSEGAKAAGRDLSDIDRISAVMVVTGKDEAEIEAGMGAVRTQIAFYASTPDYLPVLETHGWDVGEHLSSLARRGEWAEMGKLITDDMLHEVAVVAPFDSLGQVIRHRYGDRLQRVGYYSLQNGHDWPEEIWRDLVASTRG
ncbi:MAG: TIGR03617 family F420-dependent LLM class oxidoreductase [Acidimicrobiia bacterium]